MVLQQKSSFFWYPDKMLGNKVSTRQTILHILFVPFVLLKFFTEKAANGV